MRKIANLLTFYRIAAAPLVAAMAFMGARDAFFILLIVSLATDAIDGPLARLSGTVSRTGARLDTIADGLTTFAGLIGIYIFERHLIEPDAGWLYAFLATYAAAALACLIKFGVLPAYHLYLSKLGAVMAGLFVVWLYLFDYPRSFLIAVFVVGMLASIESLLATMKLRKFRTDIGSVLKI